MSPAHVLEPTYDALRRQLLAGTWPSGRRLEAARLASDLGVSITPVRDSLNRLAGEDLIQASPGEGFHVPSLSESEFVALLDWHHALIKLALAWPGADLRPMRLPLGHNGIADRTALLFAAIGDIAGSGEVVRALAGAAARLSRYRQREEQVLSDLSGDLDRLETCVRADDRAGLRPLVEDYHAKRRTAAALLVDLTRAE